MKSTTKAGVITALAVLWAAVAQAAPQEVQVTAQVETDPTQGDADDPAIWVHPTDPARSLVLGTDKQIGLRVYGLDGALVQDLPDGRLNNVDLRPIGDPGNWLVGASKREDDTMAFYLMDADGHLRQATPFQHPGHPSEMADEVDDIYGFALQRLPETGQIFALVNYKSGHVFQWEVTLQGDQLSTHLARHWRLDSQPEGIVSDDRAGMIYIGEEDAAIWAVPGDPSQPAELLQVAEIPSACLPKDDVEGLAVYDDGAHRYLVASAQGIHRAAIYDLEAEGTPCLGLVEIAAGEVDGVSETDGLAVTASPLPGFPQGLLVMMDDQNAGFTTNFKLISWASIARKLGLR